MPWHSIFDRFTGKTSPRSLDEILVGEDRRPVRATVGVVVELSEMDELIDRASIGLEVADQLLVLYTELGCRR